MRISVFENSAVAVFGLGASGNATANALRAGGADVVVWDDNPAGRASAEQAGLVLQDLSTADWSRFAALILAPGVPLTHPEPHWTVKKAKAAGVEVIGDVELFFRQRAVSCPDAPVIAITGTNGKSTTTALIAHVLSALGTDTQLGGNIGRAVLTLDDFRVDRVYVLELSSFQIDLTPSLKPTVGVLLNITPDHIDRHGTLENYAAVKERLVRASSTACISLDDPITRAMAKRLSQAVTLAGFTTGAAETLLPRVAANAGTLIVEGSPFASIEGVRSLRGRHNAENAAAAIAAVHALEQETHGRFGLWRQGDLEAALRSYPGLAHRMEEIGSIGNMLFINDSKATNAESTDKALSAWTDGIYWIAGGKAKDGGITALAPFFARVSKAYLIGDAAEAFAATLEGKVLYEKCGTLDVAIAQAAHDAAHTAAKQPIVLLSPACASYDQFKNFEHRGEAFRNLVAALPGFVPR